MCVCAMVGMMIYEQWVQKLLPNKPNKVNEWERERERVSREKNKIQKKNNNNNSYLI